MDYNISLQDEKDIYSPNSQPMSFNNAQFQSAQIKTTQQQSNNGSKQKNNIQYIDQSQSPSGITKFCQLKFYQQFFKVSQFDVTQRIKLSFIPIKTVFIQSLGNNPDFCGPFWLLTTIIFLLSSTGNLSRYFYNWSKDVYGVLIVYSFGFGFPTALHFIIKFLGGSKLSLPELICLYGYSFSCFIPIFLLCIIPAQPLQWILIAYGTINTTVFLIMNLKQYLQDLQVPKTYVVFGIIVGAQLTLFLTFKLVFFKMVYEVNE